mgnify:CR=1 FL=1
MACRLFLVLQLCSVDFAEFGRGDTGVLGKIAIEIKFVAEAQPLADFTQGYIFGEQNFFRICSH